jgi:superfamily II DNA or RNA helicase
VTATIGTTAAERLYPHQQEALEAIRHAHNSGTRSVAVVMPTGGGKTKTFSVYAHEVHLRTRRRILIIAHRKELIESAAKRQRRESPDLTVGIVKAHQNQTLADIVVCSIQTITTTNRLRQLHDVALIIIDECHHAASPSYRKVLAQFPDALVLGVTATFSRADGVALGQTFSDVVYRVPISVLQARGILVHARGYRVGVPSLDLSRIRTTAGDYSDGQLDAALSASLAPQAIVRAVMEHAPHDSAVVFTPGVHFAQVMDLAFRSAGFSSAWISGETPDRERERILAGVDDGTIQIINNCGVMTEGTDIPRLKTVVPKPTKSNGAYVQMVGRALRAFRGYTHATVLDPVGATAMHSLNARVELFGEDAAEQLEREPCDCDASGRPCSCGRRRCTSDCACGGGAPEHCSCTRPEKLEVAPAVAVDEEPRVDGELFTVEVDLYHASSNNWLVTAGGTWFLAAGDRFIALVPGRRRHTWSAVSASREPGGGSTWIQRDIPDKGYLMAWAEDEVTAREARTARKGRSWRAQRVTLVQEHEARKLGLVLPAGAHSGQVADMIAIEQASRRFDDIVEQLQREQS